MRVKALITTLAALSLAMTACGGGSAASPSVSASPSGTRPASTATLTIVRPAGGETIEGSTLNVRVVLKGAKIVSVTSTDLKPDEGHLHLILDDQLISMTSTTTTQIPNVAPGSHLLKVEFVANDHGPFFPNVVAVTSFEVQG